MNFSKSFTILHCGRLRQCAHLNYCKQHAFPRFDNIFKKIYIIYVLHILTCNSGQSVSPCNLHDTHLDQHRIAERSRAGKKLTAALGLVPFDWMKGYDCQFRGALTQLPLGNGSAIQAKMCVHFCRHHRRIIACYFKYLRVFISR